jgi:light-regulated signal transduction histidine kinase (bacteriophytochrome)
LPRVDLPGLVWAAREPVWIPDVAEETRFPRAAVAAAEGLHGAFGFPVLLGDEVRGVLEFFSQESRELDQEVLDMFTPAGTQIGQFMERKRAEEELGLQARELARSNAELEQFAYVASHDLQEPLRMVASFTQLLEKRYKNKLDADADEFISYTVNGAIQMQNLINDLLSLSRVSTQGKPLTATSCDIVLEAVRSNLRAAIEESGAAVDSDALPTVMADETQLVQLFQNLIGNAIKFRGDKPVEVRIGAERRGFEWLFWVRDNGIGIAPQYADRIFVVFQRLQGRTAYPGTGIGLSICKKIVERHGGRIWVESEEGKGSIFYFTFPAGDRKL